MSNGSNPRRSPAAVPPWVAFVRSKITQARGELRVADERLAEAQKEVPALGVVRATLREADAMGATGARALDLLEDAIVAAWKRGGAGRG